MQFSSLACDELSGHVASTIIYRLPLNSCNLSCCCVQVDARGITAFAAAQALHSLCLFNCQLDDDTAKQLLTSFQEGGFAQLRELDLSGNNVHQILMQKLLSVLQEPSTASALKV